MVKKRQGKASAKKSSKKNKEHSLEYKILKHFKSAPADKLFSWKKLIRQFSKKHGKEEVVKAIQALIEKGQLENLDGNRLQTKRTRNLSDKVVYEGKVDMTERGTAYVMCEGLDRDIFVSSNKTGRAMHGDTVKVSVFKVRKGGRMEGEIIDIVKRTQSQFIGTVHASDKFAFLVPDKANMNYDIYIPLSKLNNAKHGEKAIAKITDWPEGAKKPIGEIIETIGEAGKHDVEMKAILIENGFELTFPEAVEKEVAVISEEITQEEIDKRHDFREVLTFTIDPDDAKDFDDALSIRKLENGNWEVGVHIADVSHYVLPDSPLDKEAHERATSVYLVDRVLPMLPEKLSNKVCSLRPNEDKLTFATVFEITDNAEVKSVWYGKTIINSNRRFTYAQAQELIEGKAGELSSEIKTLDAIAKKLREQRTKEGSIAFSSEEVKFKLDETGKPIGIEMKVMKDANQLIEDFMLLANRYVAKYLSKLRVGKKLIPSVYRVHDRPDESKLEDFAEFAKKFGYKLSFEDGKQIAATINTLLEKIKGRPEQHILEQLAIRSMAKATYTTKNIGHYGLAFEYYTHFTSPIRRYPDVLVHRILHEYMKDGEALYHDSVLEDKCRHSSERERAAMIAERESVKYKQVEYMQEHVGEEFDGVISGVIHRGIFVELIANKCEGFVGTQDLGDGTFVFDESRFLLQEAGTGRRFQLGEPIKVKVAGTKLEKRQIDFVLVEVEATQPAT